MVFDPGLVDRETVSAAITRANDAMSDDDADAKDAGNVLGDL